MKKLLFLFLFLSTVSSAQKPMVGYTIDEIKNYNLVFFGTQEWNHRSVPAFLVISTSIKSIEIQTFYYFSHDNNKNVMCVHATENNITARLIAEAVAENSIWISTNKFYNKKTELVTEYEYLESGLHIFLFYKE